MAGAFVQSTTGNAVTSPTVTTAFASATTGTNLIFVVTSDDSGLTTSVTAVTDNKSNTYTKILHVAGTSSMSVWYAKNIAGGSGHTVSVTWNEANTGRCAVAAQELSGLDTTAPLDKSTSATGTSTAPSSGASAATVQADELVCGALSYGGTVTTTTLGSGYTNLGKVDVANTGVAAESKVVAATGAQTATFTLAASRTWLAAVVTFKAAGGGGGGGGGSPKLGAFLPFLSD